MTTTSRGTCSFCSWECVLRQDGNMRRHFVATRVNAQGKRVQDTTAGRCPGGGEAPAGQCESLESRILAAYGELVYEPGGWVSLTRLRDYLSTVSREDLDVELSRLFTSFRIRLIGEVNRKTLTDRDRAAALHIVGDEKHLYQPK